MKLSIQINPLKTISENELRSLPMVVANVARTHGARKALGVAQGIAGRVKKQRAHVRQILDSQLPKLRKFIGADVAFKPTPNFFRVTLIRISAGTLDEGSVASALKAVQDEVAAWIGIDDGPRAPASWRYGQQKGPQKTYAVRIEIEDDDPDPHECNVVLGPTIAHLGPVVGDVQHAPRTVMGMLNAAYKRETADAPRALDEHPSQGRMSVARHARALGMTTAQMKAMAPLKCAEIERSMKQAPLIFRKSFAIIPEEQDESDEWTLRPITPPRDAKDDPPPRISIAGRAYTRRLDSNPALGEHWIYEAAPSAARAEESRATR